MGLNIEDEGVISRSIATLPSGYELYPDVTITKLHPYTSAGYTPLPLWERGVYNEGIEIPTGTWELHVFFEWTAAEGMYTIAISVSVAGVPSTWALQLKKSNYISAGSFNDRFDFEMGLMPSGLVTVNHVKGHSTNFSTNQMPPQADW